MAPNASLNSNQQEYGLGRDAAEHQDDFDAPRPSRLGTQHQSYADILKSKPERALRKVTQMAEDIEAVVSKLTIQNKLRDDEWKQDLKKLRKAKRERPEIKIAVCGATGAGKSSLLNAVLGVNAIPTSGTQACTSVVTTISYSKSDVPHAEISFLSKEEWRQELQILLTEWSSHIAEHAGKAVIPKDEDAKVAWEKVHAVYPDLLMDDLEVLTVDSFLELYPDVTEKLGQVEEVVAEDSQEFLDKISKYIDAVSKDDGDGDSGLATQEMALWPLIREVRVYCNAKALSKGAVLVDLPGVADSNAARNNVSKEYLKEADNIWVVAPIHRAVSDQTAKNGSYDSRRITFIASRTDDVSCREIIRSLKLHTNPTLKEIQERLDPLEKPYKGLQKTEAATAKIMKGERHTAFPVCISLVDSFEATKRKYAAAKAAQGELRTRLAALQGATASGSAFVTRSAPRHTAGKRKAEGLHAGQARTKRARRSGQPTSDDSDFRGESDSDSETNNSEDELDGLYGEEQSTHVVLEVLQAKLQAKDEEVERLKSEVEAYMAAGRQILEQIADLKSQMDPIQKEKNTFCALQRNKYSRTMLKEDFRSGLRDLEDSIAEAQLGEDFDPTQNTRDYSDLDLPVFTCSSRDYMKLTGQVTGDGPAVCFADVEDTGVPALQQWCQDLTLAIRQELARDYLSLLQTLANQVIAYVLQAQALGEATIADRKKLYRLYDSRKARNLGKLGIAARLNKEFYALTQKCADDMKKSFKEGLEEQCCTGVEKAKEKIDETVETFEKIHHSTYRATIRRYGSWRRDINVELVDPFTSSIARAFSAMFETDKFGPLEVAVYNRVMLLGQEFEKSAAEDLKSGAKLQNRTCRNDVKPALQKAMAVAKETMSNQRREISHSLAPHVQEALREGYDRAKLEKGRGCVARMKGHFRDIVDDKKETMFDEAATSVLGGLEGAATAVGKALQESLCKLARQVELTLAVVWEEVPGGKDEIAARDEAMKVASHVKEQTELWLAIEDPHEEEDYDMLYGDQ
ncbi:hypothetical protein NMY22_g232 [Coprinellus aureogranulatus]|nr:hypothetical protein NMY22_g232 [Coprinellus aureogranulatus]